MLTDPINRRILAVAEDRVTGFHPLPFDVIAKQCGLDVGLVLERLKSMLAAGVVRRVRQTLLSTALADGALLAWKVPEEKLETAFCWLRDNDPFSGHIVLRRCDKPDAPGADYRLWTTLKVPTGCGGVDAHCRLLMPHIGALSYTAMPVVGMFVLAVGHIRRAGLKPGDRMDTPPPMQVPPHPQLSEREWVVLLALKESLQADELVRDPWSARARGIGMEPNEFNAIAARLDARRVIGRFAVFLDHQRPANHHSGIGAAGLFHWTVPAGSEERAGAECGRHLCMTHCYWRSGAAPFNGAQIMGVVHAASRQEVLAHKEAIDQHLAACGIPLLHTAVFWSERSEIRPSEISPIVYRRWQSAL